MVIGITSGVSDNFYHTRIEYLAELYFLLAKRVVCHLACGKKLGIVLLLCNGNIHEPWM